MTESDVEAIVPVRGLPAGKRRLAELLSVEQRNRLVRAMLDDVVETLRDAASVDVVTILSRDAAAAREAQRLGVGFLRQPDSSDGLNAGLSFALRERSRREAILIVPADLPLVTPGDIEALMGQEPGGALVAIAPSRDGGTNGLLLRPPLVIEPAYGPGSAARHGAAAELAGVARHEVDTERWRLDIDTPEDLGRLLAIATEGSARNTLACLRSDDFPAIAAAE